MKRLFDFFLGLVGLFASLPLWLIFGLALWLEERGNIFYIQNRVGLNGKIFNIIKFRTMNKKNGEVSKFANLLRKTALDELPQLINILRSEMSFVGPRPIIPEEIGNNTDFQIRLKVKPGLTGAAQVLLPKDASPQEKLKHDIWYMNNHNLWLDIRLILKSFWNSLRHRWDV